MTDNQFNQLCDLLNEFLDETESLKLIFAEIKTNLKEIKADFAEMLGKSAS